MTPSPRSALAVVLSGALLATATACVVPAMGSADCLDRDEVKVLEGPQPRFPNKDNKVSDGMAVDARQATWMAPLVSDWRQKYPLVFEGDHEDVCFVGGYVTNELPHETTDWYAWHDAGATVNVKFPGLTLIDTTIENTGDAIAIAAPALRDWTLSGVHVIRAHDDCIQNDAMLNGRVDRSFFDGCYVFYSSRASRNSTEDGSGKTVTITNSLVRMEAMPFVFDPDKYQAPGHGPIFKVSESITFGTPPELSIHNTIFRVDQHPSIGRVDLPVFDHDQDPATPPRDLVTSCSNNTVVWTGDGPYPDPLPDCFTVTTDVSVWDDAVAEWHAGRDS